MTTLTFKGSRVETNGTLPAVGDTLPDFTLTTTDLGEVTSDDFEGRRLVINIFPSVDTGVCAMQVRTFNKAAANLDRTSVIAVSMDLPFALSRFCGAEGIDNVQTLSAFRSTFGTDFGVTMTSGPAQGLFARAVLVVDDNRTVIHSELVSEVGDEPDYEAAIAALGH